MKSKTKLLDPKSIQAISMTAVGAAGTVSMCSIALLILLGVYQDFTIKFQTERQRLAVLAPIVTEPLSSELFVGTPSVASTITNGLMKKHSIKGLKIVEVPPPECETDSVLRAFFASGEMCFAHKIPNVSTSRYVLLTADIPFNMNRALLSLLWIGVPLFLFCAVIIRRVRSKLRNSVVEPLGELACDPENWKPSEHAATEIITLHERLTKYIEERDKRKEEADKNAFDASLSRWAEELAHDLGPSAMALREAVSDLKEIPEEDRSTIRTIVESINDMTQRLLNLRELKNGTLNSCDLTTHLVSSVLDSTVSEKRLHFRNRLGVYIKLTLNEASYGLFSRFSVTDFRRVISNLITNAVEAINEKGIVEITLEGTKDAIRVQVRDNGKGIPKDRLPQLMQRGASFDKEKGHGYGLFQAQNTVQCWGGNITIKSEVGEGTQITLTLPPAFPPTWFVPAVTIAPRTSVVILDDDPSIHHVWQKRFSRKKLSDKKIKVTHCRTGKELDEWHVEHLKERSSVLYLIDYELLGDKKNGLQIIESLGIGSRSILVTSRFDDETVLETLSRLSVGLIPKMLASIVPITIAEAQTKIKVNEEIDAILIDDHSITHMTWEKAAREQGKNLRIFQRPDQFFASAATIRRATPVYIDSKLGDGLKGEEVAKQIYGLGFKEIRITTSYPKDKFQNLPHIKDIVGKAPPAIWRESPPIAAN